MVDWKRKRRPSRLFAELGGGSVLVWKLRGVKQWVFKIHVDDALASTGIIGPFETEAITKACAVATLRAIIEAEGRDNG